MATAVRVTTIPRENKKVLYRWCGEVFNKKRLAAIDELKVPNYADWSRFPGQAPTLESYKVTLGIFFTAFPDFHYGIEDTIVEGEFGLVVGTWNATHSGPFLGLPPTGRAMTGKRIDFFRFSDGKMSEHWGTGLELDVLRLMGFTPPEPPPGPRDGRSISRSFIKGVLRDRNPIAIDQLYDGDAQKQSLGLLALHAAFPEARVNVEHTIVEGDKVAVHSTLSGAHTGTYLGLAPTGKEVAVARIDVLRIGGGRVTESWHQWDNVGLLLQLGAIDVPALASPAANGHGSGNGHGQN